MAEDAADEREEEQPDPRDAVEVPAGMRLVKCGWADWPDAYLLLPAEWLVKHVDAYYSARTAAFEAGHKLTNTLQLAGALAQFENGWADIQGVPGVGQDASKWDLAELPAKLMGWLIWEVAWSIEATQRVPLASRGASAPGGTT